MSGVGQGKYHTCGNCGATDGKVTCVGLLSDNPTLVCEVCQWRGAGPEFKNTDTRPARLGWAPGDYFCTCADCGAMYTGAKRSSQCADCAYAVPEREQSATKTGDLFQMSPNGNKRLIATVFLTEGELNSLIHALGVVSVSVDGREWNKRNTGIDTRDLRQELVIVRDDLVTPEPNACGD